MRKLSLYFLLPLILVGLFGVISLVNNSNSDSRSIIFSVSKSRVRRVIFDWKELEWPYEDAKAWVEHKKAKKTKQHFKQMIIFKSSDEKYWDDVKDQIKYYQTHFGKNFPKNIKLTIPGKGIFPIGHLLTVKKFADIKSSIPALSQLVALKKANVKSSDLFMSYRTIRQKLVNLWKTIQPVLLNYPHPSLERIRFGHRSFRIDQLFAYKNFNRLAGSSISNEGTPSARSQLQALVDGNLTTAIQMQTALANANNQLLDDKWNSLKTNLAGYSGFQSAQVEIGSKSYTLTDLWTKSTTDDAGSTFTDNARSQLQTLVNNQITWDQIKTQLDILNNQKLDVLWNTFKKAFKNYAGVNDKRQLWSLLLQNKDSPTPGHSLERAVRNQLQELVNTGHAIESIRAATDLVNHSELDQFWNNFKDELANYPGFKSKTVTINEKMYSLTDLWTKSTDPSHPAGSTFTDKAKTQLQVLVNENITWDQIKTQLDLFNNQKLDTLWTALKNNNNLGGYTGFNPGDTDITIGGKQYKLNLLIENKGSDTAGSALEDPIKDQLQNLVNAGITNASAVRTALNTANNNRKLDDLWTEILALFNRREYDPETDVIIAKDKTYAFKILPLLTQVTQSQNDSGSTLEDDPKKELQALVNDGITVRDIEAYWNSLEKTKTPSPPKTPSLVKTPEKVKPETEKSKPETDTKKQDLNIGLGTAGGVVGLAGATGFAYYFMKIRKS